MTECICECRATPDLTASSVRIGRAKPSRGCGAPSTRWTEDEKVGQLFINLNNRFDDDLRQPDRRQLPPRWDALQPHRLGQRSRLTSGTLRAGRRFRCWWPRTSRQAATAPAPTARMSPRRCRPRPLPTPTPPGRWAWSALGSRGRWAATGPSHRYVDIHSNWRNTVIATRAFGNDHETVITYARGLSARVSARAPVTVRSRCA